MEYKSFPVYRGLQKPLEFMGLKGRYVYVAAGAVSGAILSFILIYILAGFLLAFILTLLILLSGAIWIFRKQKKGLHSKPTQEGIYYITHIIRIDK